MDLIGALAQNALHALQRRDSLGRACHPDRHRGRRDRLLLQQPGDSFRGAAGSRLAAGETGHASSIGAISARGAGIAGAACSAEIRASGRRAFSACRANICGATHGATHQESVGGRCLAESGLIVAAGCCVRSGFVGGLLLLGIERQLLEAAGGG